MNDLVKSDESSSPLRRWLGRVPGGTQAMRQLERAEQLLMTELRQRLDRVQPATPSVSVLAVSVEGRRDPSASVSPFDLGSRLQALLQASAEQSREQAESAYYRMVLEQMLPDHARLLSALSDGSTYPVLQVLGSTRLGLPAELLLEGVSSVARQAGLMWPDAGHAYVQQLRVWGLVEYGPELAGQTTQYEILETHSEIRRSIGRMQKGGQKAMLLRRSLCLSELGRALWAASQIGLDRPGWTPA